MPKEIAIHKMVDQVFEKGVNRLVDEIAEEIDNIEARKAFLTNLQMLFLNDIENSTLIELATTKQKD